MVAQQEFEEASISDFTSLAVLYLGYQDSAATYRKLDELPLKPEK